MMDIHVPLISRESDTNISDHPKRKTASKGKNNN
jgi:hypothetical protein